MSSNIKPTLAIQGNLAKDPLTGTGDDGQPWAVVRIASTTRRPDPASGQWHDAGTEYTDVRFRGSAAAAIARLAADGRLGTGSKVVATGRLGEPDAWTGRDGTPHAGQVLLGDTLAADIIRETQARARAAGPKGPAPSADDDPWRDE